VEQDEPVVMLRSEVVDLFGTLKEKEKELEKLKMEVKAAAAGVYIAGLSRNRVFLSDGSQLGLGDVLEGTEHAGKRIISIDYAARLVRVDGGVIVRVGMPNGGADKSVSLSNLSGTVRSVTSGDESK
jgi:hypothetical protein